MNILTIIPDQKLKIKNYLIFGTVTLFLLLIAIILQFTIPLGRHVNHSDVAIIVWPVLLGLVIILFLFGGIISKLWIDNLEYVINNERITIKKGILTKIEQNIPFRAVTDFQLHRSLFDRLLNIGSLRIQTAGQSSSPTGYEGNLAGLREWQNLLEELRARVKEFRERHEDESDQAGIKQDKDNVEQILAEVTKIRKLLENK